MRKEERLKHLVALKYLEGRSKYKYKIELECTSYDKLEFTKEERAVIARGVARNLIVYLRNLHRDYRGLQIKLISVDS